MGLDLMRVEQLQSWEGVAGAPTVWVVKGVTVEEQPRMLKVRTLKPLHASACERALRTGRLLWVGWRDARHGAKDMTTVRLDDTAFSEVAI
jgi:hypothetical protein